jgi:GAF domain
MPASRRNLKLDEQSFQSVLSAAFTIQEYYDRSFSDGPTADTAECAELRNLIQTDPDLNLQAVGAGAGESLDAEFLEYLEKLLNVPALAIEGSDGRGSKATTIGEKNQDAAAQGFVPDPDARREQIAATAAEQLVQIDDLAAMPGAAVTDGTMLPNAMTREARKEVAAVPDHLLREVVQQALQATHATSVAIALEQQGKLICRAAAGDSAPEIGTMINIGSRFTGACAASGTMQLCSNTAVDRRVDAEACRKLGVRTIVVAPLLHQDQSLGLIAVFSSRPYAFGMHELRELEHLVEKFIPNLQVGPESVNADS